MSLVNSLCIFNATVPAFNKYGICILAPHRPHAPFMPPFASARGGEPFFHALSPSLVKSLTRCLVYWRMNQLCTMVMESHFCFCIWLLESVLGWPEPVVQMANPYVFWMYWASLTRDAFTLCKKMGGERRCILNVPSSHMYNVLCSHKSVTSPLTHTTVWRFTFTYPYR
jgi:hypothetical protein